MKKKSLLILIFSISVLIIVIGVSIKPLTRVYNNYQKSKYLEGFNPKATLYEEYPKFLKGLENIDPTVKDKKFIYVNVWASFCIPCMKEMPMLDSIAALYSNVKFVFITKEPNDKISSLLNRKNIHLKNCIFLNEMNNLCYGLSNTEKINPRIYPLHLIFDQNGKILFRSNGAFGNGVQGFLPAKFKQLGIS